MEMIDEIPPPVTWNKKAPVVSKNTALSAWSDNELTPQFAKDNPPQDVCYRRVIWKLLVRQAPFSNGNVGSLSLPPAVLFSMYTCFYVQ